MFSQGRIQPNSVTGHSDLTRRTLSQPIYWRRLTDPKDDPKSLATDPPQQLQRQQGAVL